VFTFLQVTVSISSLALGVHCSRGNRLSHYYVTVCAGAASIRPEGCFNLWMDWFSTCCY